MKRLFSIVIFGVLALTGTTVVAMGPPTGNARVYYMQENTREIPLFDDFKVSAYRYSISQDSLIYLGLGAYCNLYKGKRRISKSYNSIYTIGRTIFYENYRMTGTHNIECKEVGILTHDGTPIKIENCQRIECLELVPSVWYGLVCASDQYFVVTDKNQKQGVIDSLGQQVLPCIYSNIYAVNDSVILTDDYSKTHYYNLSGEQIDYKRTEVSRDSSQKKQYLLKYGNWGCSEYDLYKCDPKFWERDGYKSYYNFNYPVVKNDSGDEILCNPEGVPITQAYTQICPFSCNYAVVRQGGEVQKGYHIEGGVYGIINAQGQEVVSLNYTKEAIVTIMRKLQDEAYKERAFPKYDFISSYCCYYDRKTVKYRGKWGAIDPLGNEILEPIYDTVLLYGNDKFQSLVRKAGKWGMADYFGRIVAPPIYDQITFSRYTNCVHLRLGDKDFALLYERELVELKVSRPDLFTVKARLPVSQHSY